MSFCVIYGFIMKWIAHIPWLTWWRWFRTKTFSKEDEHLFLVLFSSIIESMLCKVPVSTEKINMDNLKETHEQSGNRTPCLIKHDQTWSVTWYRTQGWVTNPMFGRKKENNGKKTWRWWKRNWISLMMFGMSKRKGRKKIKAHT